jgi:phosphate starvation-inducible PhoH-like protein
MAVKKPRNKKASDTEFETALERNFSLNIKLKKPFRFTNLHADFHAAITNPSSTITFVDGAAGTAKSYIAVLAALEAFLAGDTKRIIYIRSVIESASRSIGALPGEIDDKFLPYAAPLIEKVTELTNESTASQLKSLGILQAVPVNFVRGLTFNDSIVIIDEAQNLSRNELKTCLTRFGRRTKYIVCGDISQSDIGTSSGYKDIFDVFNGRGDKEDHGITCFKFGETEIVRSKILRYIVGVLDL